MTDKALGPDGWIMRMLHCLAGHHRLLRDEVRKELGGLGSPRLTSMEKRLKTLEEEVENVDAAARARDDEFEKRVTALERLRPLGGEALELIRRRLGRLEAFAGEEQHGQPLDIWNGEGLTRVRRQ